MEKLLFVTTEGNNDAEGFSYALDLAKSLNAGLEVLVVNTRKALQSFEDIMAAAAFAEAGDLRTVREIMEGEEKAIKADAEKRMREMAERCRECSVDFIYRPGSGEAVSEIKDFLKDKPNIKMVVLAPNLATGKTSLKKLLKDITKPVVYLKPIRVEE